MNLGVTKTVNICLFVSSASANFRISTTLHLQDLMGIVSFVQL